MSGEFGAESFRVLKAQGARFRCLDIDFKGFRVELEGLGLL